MQFEWTDFYMELADKLLDFKNDRASLIENIKDIYTAINIKLPTLEKGNDIVDIDPFTVYGLFNKGITNANRMLIMNQMAKTFEIDAKVPANFDGIPVLNNLFATFYGFKDGRSKAGGRGVDDIDNLWILFEIALKLDRDPENGKYQHDFISAYNTARGQFGVKWNITMGLYWIRPYTFINLDSRNRWFLTQPNILPADYVVLVSDALSKNEIPSGEIYLDMCMKCADYMKAGRSKYISLPELSYYAWLESDNVSKNQIKDKKKKEKSNAEFLKWFAPVIKALRDLGGSATAADTRNKIIENEHLTKEQVSITRGKTKVNKFENEVAFARNYLVKGGYIDKSVRGVWTLTEAGEKVDMTEELASEIFKTVVAQNQQAKQSDGVTAGEDIDDGIRYWTYAPGEDGGMWKEMQNKGIMAIGWGEIGAIDAFQSKEEIRDKMKEVYGGNSSYKNSVHAVWQFCNVMKPGDIVFVKKGRTNIIGRGIVESEYMYDDERTDGYNNIRKVKWTHDESHELEIKLALKTLTDVTPYTDYVDKLNELYDTDLELEDEEEKEYKAYTKIDFLEDVYMSEENYDTLVSLLRHKKNIILQGAPGVGKTFAARRLAYSMMGEKNSDRVMLVQFHQSYSYEDFVEGYRPSAEESGFVLTKGVFYNFCRKAEIDSDNEYFFIIDEINRGNLSKIFGELFMLIEKDKRNQNLQLLYSRDKFNVPKNVYIIGMMNTADRSLAMIDYALRRRFSFFELKPGFETEGFTEYRMKLDNSKFDKLIKCTEELNSEISLDETLGEGFCIGHSYFCDINSEELTDQRLMEIVEFELIPLLKEYWFDEPKNVERWSEKLRGAIS